MENKSQEKSQNITKKSILFATTAIISLQIVILICFLILSLKGVELGEGFLWIM